MSMLSPEEFERLLPAETASVSSPVLPPRNTRRHAAQICFAPLGDAEGPVKSAILGLNSAKMHKHEIDKAGLETDRVSIAKAEHEKYRSARGNRRYGYVVQG